MRSHTIVLRARALNCRPQREREREIIIILREREREGLENRSLEAERKRFDDRGALFVPGYKIRETREREMMILIRQEEINNATHLIIIMRAHRED